jgi:RsiW-degrading membrane proteinase PrsW (M82 family)
MASLSPKWMLVAIMSVVLVWGVAMAVQAVRYNGNPWRAVVVLACFGVFLGGWLILLVRRQRAGEASKRNY